MLRGTVERTTNGRYPFAESMSEASERKLREYAENMRERTTQAMRRVSGENK